MIYFCFIKCFPCHLESCYSWFEANVNCKVAVCSFTPGPSPPTPTPTPTPETEFWWPLLLGLSLTVVVLVLIWIVTAKIVAYFRPVEVGWAVREEQSWTSTAHDPPRTDVAVEEGVEEGPITGLNGRIMK